MIIFAHSFITWFFLDINIGDFRISSVLDFHKEILFEWIFDLARVYKLRSLPSLLIWFFGIFSCAGSWASSAVLLFDFRVWKAALPAPPIRNAFYRSCVCILYDDVTQHGWFQFIITRYFNDPHSHRSFGSRRRQMVSGSIVQLFIRSLSHSMYISVALYPSLSPCPAPYQSLGMDLDMDMAWNLELAPDCLVQLPLSRLRFKVWFASNFIYFFHHFWAGAYRAVFAFHRFDVLWPL